MEIKKKMELCRGIITVEGIVGVGKSTLLKLLVEELTDIKIILCPEPVDVWEEELVNEPIYVQQFLQQGKTIQPGTNALSEMYQRGIQNKENEIVAAFQYFAMVTRWKCLMQAIEEGIRGGGPFLIIGERIIFADGEIFVRSLIDQGRIDITTAAILSKTRNIVFGKIPELVRLIIKVEAPVETCQSRTKARGRKGEQDISEEYQKQLLKYHEEMYKSKENMGVQIFSVDWSQNNISESDIKRVKETLANKIRFDFLVWLAERY